MGVTVVLADNLHRALSDLDAPARKRVVDFLIKLQTEPHSSGTRLKKLENARDSRVRTARVTDDLRAVLLHLGGSTYVVQTVLRHDDANRYAEQLRLGVNKTTGAVEIVETARIETYVRTATAARQANGVPVLAHVSAADFDQLGVPASLVPALQRIDSEDELLDFVGPLPALQQDIVLSLVGRAPDKVYDEVVVPARGDGPVETDLAAALRRPVNQSTYLVVTEAEELADALAWPMDRWRIYLHPSQRTLAYPLKHYSGPFRVTGGPGTGKTVVAVHRAKALAAASASHDRILLTTYGGTLAKSLEELLTRLDGGRTRKQVDVLTTDKLARRILDGIGWRRNVIGDDVCLALLRTQAAQAGLDVDSRILHEEWNQVVLDQQRYDLASYLSARRRGMRRLSPAARQQIWPVLDSFARYLSDNRMATFRQMTEEAARVAAELPTKPYRHLIVDEAQDMTPAQWRLLRSVVPAAPDDMFVVGDAHQRIYDSNAILSHYGIHTRGRSKRLTISYRTTREIVRAGLAIVKGHHYDDLDDGLDTLDGYRSLMHGPRPRATGYATAAAEFAAVADRVASWHSAGVPLADIAVGVRIKQLAASIADALVKQAIPATVVSNDGHVPDDAVHVMTLHRLKGLEYRCVALAAMREGMLPPSSRLATAANDPAALQSVQKQERALIFVACTRAREALSVTWHEAPSQLITPLIAQSFPPQRRQ
jgi:superfamily I DNA/RNA helicase